MRRPGSWWCHLVTPTLIVASFVNSRKDASDDSRLFWRIRLSLCWGMIRHLPPPCRPLVAAVLAGLLAAPLVAAPGLAQDTPSAIETPGRAKFQICRDWMM